MDQFKVEEYTINICQDIYEWGHYFYELPKNAEIENIEELQYESMGFASIVNKEIWIYVKPNQDKKDYSITIAHEIGHIIEGGYKKNPAPRMNKLHEKKAEHYELFFKIVSEIIDKTELLLKK